jgi:hypothetical protein
MESRACHQEFAPSSATGKIDEIPGCLQGILSARLSRDSVFWKLGPGAHLRRNRDDRTEEKEENAISRGLEIRGLWPWGIYEFSFLQKELL